MAYYSIFTGAEVDALLGRVETSVGVTGVVDLPIGQADGTVSESGLPFVPTKCVLTVELPAESSDPPFLAAALVGPPTADGFDFRLSAAPAETGYRLHYHLSP